MNKSTLSSVVRGSMLASLSLFSYAANANKIDMHKLFPSKTVYIGINVGGGATTWKYLVDKYDPPPNPISATTPSHVDEGGAAWGIVFGFDVSSNFAIEFQYVEFPDSKITFDDFGKVTYMLQSNTITSHTEAYSLSGKFYLPVGVNTHLRAFSAVGAGLVKRDDIINEVSCVTPYMSAGLSYNFTRHLISEVGFQYFTGFGASEVLPVQDFVPFAWDAYFRLAYQF